MVGKALVILALGLASLPSYADTSLDEDTSTLAHLSNMAVCVQTVEAQIQHPNISVLIPTAVAFIEVKRDIQHDLLLPAVFNNGTSRLTSMSPEELLETSEWCATVEGRLADETGMDTIRNLRGNV